MDTLAPWAIIRSNCSSALGEKSCSFNVDLSIQFPFIIQFVDKLLVFNCNIPSTIVYSALVGEFLRIGRSTLKLQHFTPKAEELLDRMIAQGAKVSISKKKILKIMSDHPEDFFSVQKWVYYPCGKHVLKARWKQHTSHCKYYLIPWRQVIDLISKSWLENQTPTHEGLPLTGTWW